MSVETDIALSGSEGLNCDGFRHFFDTSDGTDCHWDEEEEDGIQCTLQPCPNREYSRDRPRHPRIPSWWVDPEHYQLLPLPSISSFEFLELDSTFLDSQQFLHNVVIMNDAKDLITLTTASQYPKWSATIRAYLTMSGVWDLVKSNPTPPTDQGELAVHNANIKKAQGIIMLKVHGDLWRHIVDPATDDALAPHTMWENLKKACGTIDPASAFSNFAVFVNSPRMSDSKPIADQFNKLLLRIKEVEDGGLKFEDNVKAYMFMSKLPESYQQVVSAMLLTDVTR